MMKQLYPLKFTPIIKDKIWGGNKLRTLLNKKEASDKAGESWEISGVEGDISVVSNGFLAGNNIQELIEIYMGDLVGQIVYDQFGTEFPLLLKFIDASDDLSIQVHPNDEQAAERHNSFGKTEMWVVLQADSGSKLISGFNQEIDKEHYLKKLEEKKLLEILNQEVVKAGDVFFMPAGRIHAIGSGCFIAEIQQTSDVTYRVYDYDRTDSEGNTRELHTDLAVDVIDYNFYPDYKTKINTIKNQASEVVSCKYFTTNLIELNSTIERDMVTFDSFIIYMCLEGNAQIEQENGTITEITKGETLLIPAEITNYYIKALPEAKLIEVYISNTNED